MMRGASGVLRCAVVGLACVAGALANGPARADLALEISADKTQYLVDEPIFVRVTLTNEGEQDAPLAVPLVPVGGFLSFYITAPGEEPHRYQSGVSPGPPAWGEPRLWVRAGGEWSGAADLTYDWQEGQRRTLLSRPGEYLIEARYATPRHWQCDPGEWRSNVLRVVVEEPEGVDRRAHEVLGKGARTQEWGPWNVFAEQKECYERVLREFPQSRYALYVRYYLAGVCGFMGMQTLRGTRKGAAAIGREAALLSAVAEEAEGSALGVRAMWQAGSAFAKLGKVEQAQACLERAFTSPAATDYDRGRAVAYLMHVQSGHLHEASRLAPEMTLTRLRLPLRQFAEAMGLSVKWDPETKMVTVSGPGVKAVLKPGEHPMYINGGFRGDITVSLRDGRTVVSLSVIRALMAARWGRDSAEPW